MTHYIIFIFFRIILRILFDIFYPFLEYFPSKLKIFVLYIGFFVNLLDEIFSTPDCIINMKKEIEKNERQKICFKTWKLLQTYILSYNIEENTGNKVPLKLKNLFGYFDKSSWSKKKFNFESNDHLFIYWILNHFFPKDIINMILKKVWIIIYDSINDKEFFVETKHEKSNLFIICDNKN